MKYRYLPLIIAAALYTTKADAKTSEYQITIDNTLGIDREDEPVVLSLKDLTKDMRVTQAVISDTYEEIPTQLDDLDRDGVNDELSFVVSIAKKGKRTLTLTLSDEGGQKTYTPRTWAGFMLVGRKKGLTVDVNEVTVPGHTDFYNMVHGHGPMFESELVGYRVYFNQKQTLDPYGKFNKRLELQDTKFYPDDDQLSKGYGDDVLLAGNSCGIGALKGWNGSEATHIEPVASRTERLVTTGPVRSIVEVEVKDWDYDGDKVDLLNRYTIYAGHRDLVIDTEVKDGKKHTYSTGAARIMGDETVSWSDHEGLIGSWGRHWPVNDTVKYAKETIGIASYVPKRYVVAEASDPSNFLYVVQPDRDGKMTHYTMFTSKKETFGFESETDWFGFLPEWKEKIDNPLKISIKKKK